MKFKLSIPNWARQITFYITLLCLLSGFANTSIAVTSVSQKVLITDSQGKPISGGQISWESQDGAYKSQGYVGLNSNGVRIFTSVPSGPATIHLTKGVMENGLLVSSEWGTTFSNNEVVLEIPVLEQDYEWELAIELPNHRNALNIQVHSGLFQDIEVGDFRYSIPYSMWSQYNGTSDQNGKVKLKGFVGEISTATATFSSDFGLEQHIYNFGDTSSKIVLNENPWIEVRSTKTKANFGDLVTLNVQGFTFDDTSLFNREVEILPPAGYSQNCPKKKMKGKLNAEGFAKLKFCATATGNYTVSGTGIISTNAIYLKVTGAAPTEVTNLKAVTPETGQARISWAAPIFSAGSKITRYRLQIIDADTGKTKTKSTSKNHYVFNSLKSGGVYLVKVLADSKNGAGPVSTIWVSVA